MNVQSQPSSPNEKMSIDAFARWAETQERRYELVDGVPRVQPYVKRSHALIVSNIDFALQSRLDRSTNAVYQGDFAIPTGPRSGRYADVLVEPAGAPLNDRTADAALLIVEVLSDSTASVDFGPKLQEYSRLATLQTYLIVSQDKRCVWQLSRDESGLWPEHPAIVEEGDVELASLGLTLPLDEIYRGVVSRRPHGSDA